MPKMDWKSLSEQSRSKFGAYGEYYAKMEFASYGFDVFISEVDDHGIDFVVKGKKGYFAIQVKSVQASTGYVFMGKEHFDIEDESLYLLLLIFEQEKLPDMYLMPATAWKTETDLLRYRPYDKPGHKSKPEYGINISKKNMHMLDEFKFEDIIRGII